MTTISQPQTEQQATDTNQETISLLNSRLNYHNYEERGTLNSMIQALYMPSVEEFFTDFSF
ncbi:hypothetical protein J2I47_07805 [Fibrella sp. HMF5335]|uniref:Uncharacterized protein n=1 Tax=Fibrella rubiginis TaxID=2817060 RepID=A0A939GFT3_9BACT|nr:hypothetical protein [Fibrella rubiginis]MBO0936449.1 hypothetical protein [Fibrella rubiginis]